MALECTLGPHLDDRMAVQIKADLHHLAISTKTKHHTHCLDELCFLFTPHCSLALAELTHPHFGNVDASHASIFLTRSTGLSLSDTQI